MSSSSVRVLVVGETGRGKTRLTSIIAKLLAGVAGPASIAILDFAPATAGVGTPMQPPPGSRYVRPRGLRAPRLESGGDCRSAWRLALHNSRLTSKALLSYIYSPLPALFINDATIHLHAGNPKLMVEALMEAKVAVVNAYRGVRITDRCGISERERWALKTIEGVFNEVWEL
ncbi:MAG: hypothetical protein F7B17_02035 [Desulfurococcales archaeon]|nr:hypothetical protein [Desulfurococcales archaeon]